MLVPLHRLLRRSRPRDDDWARLSARFRAQPGRWSSTAEQRGLARRLVELKREVGAAFATTSSCASCARGQPPPKGRWDGGRCCGTGTFVLFTAAEVAALALAGVRIEPTAARAEDDRAGCMFRGPTGCGLEPGQRPVVCHVYVCDDLRSELRDSAAHARIRDLRSELHATFERFLRACGLPPDRAPAPTSLVRW